MWDKIKGIFFYLWLTIKHKYYVLLAGLKVGCPIWRLIKHDWTKFLIFKETLAYGEKFYLKTNNPNFSYALLHHQNFNDHHWEYWISRNQHSQDKNTKNVLDIPKNAILELIADWMGACRAYEGHWPIDGEWEFIQNNFKNMILSETTRIQILQILSKHGYDKTVFMIQIEDMREKVYKHR